MMEKKEIIAFSDKWNKWKYSILIILILYDRFRELVSAIVYGYPINMRLHPVLRLEYNACSIDILQKDDVQPIKLISMSLINLMVDSL